MFIKKNPPTLHIRFIDEREPGLGIEATLTNIPLKTWWRQILSYAGSLVRLIFVVIAFSALYLVIVTRTRIILFGSTDLPPWPLAYLYGFLKEIDGHTIGTLAFSTIYLAIAGFRGYTEEKLIVLSVGGLMMVRSKTIRWWGQMVNSEIWLSLNSDGQFWIHDLGSRCVLAISVEEHMFGPAQDELIIVFPTLLPDRAILEEVWRAARKCFYKPKELRELAIEGNDGNITTSDDTDSNDGESDGGD